MQFSFVLVWICSPLRILGFGVQLEGLIDLGPNWGYTYKLSPLSVTEVSMFSDSDKDRKDMELTDLDTGEDKDQSISASDNLQTAVNIDLEKNLSIAHQTHKRSKKQVAKKSDVRSQTNKKSRQNADKKLKTKKKRTHKNRKSNERDTDISNGEVTKYLISNENIKRNDVKIEIFDKSKFVNFMKEVYKDSLKIWKNIQRKVWSVDLKSEVTTLKKHYKERYRQFINLFEKQKIKTKLGLQKLVLNTVETSNRIMKRLVNSLSNYENSIKGGYSILQQEVERKNQLQYAYACKKFGVCRRSNDFGDYLIEVINIILETDNAKIKQAADALTEVVKSNDFTQSIDHSTQDKLRKQIAYIELWDPLIVKSMFVILRNVMSHKNQPIVVMDTMDEELSNKTVAFHEIIDTLNENIHKFHNTTDFIKIKKQLEDWRDGKRKDVQKVFQSLIELIKDGLETMNTTAAQEFDKNMNIILKPIINKKKRKMFEI